MQIVLASQSRYRKNLLEKMGLTVLTTDPELNEDDLKRTLEQKKYSPLKIAQTLAYEKGLSVLKKFNEDSLIVSADQLVSFDDYILGKPGNFENALAQLQMMNGKTHKLITSVCIFHKNKYVQHTDVTKLIMKQLSTDEISSYLKIDQPYDCAGSYKIEQKGVILFESIDCQDFTAIQGIPMIWLSNKLKEYSYEFFKI